MNPHHSPSAIRALDLMREISIDLEIKPTAMTRALGYQYLSHIPFYPQPRSVLHIIDAIIEEAHRTYLHIPHPSRPALKAAIKTLEHSRTKHAKGINP